VQVQCTQSYAECQQTQPSTSLCTDELHLKRNSQRFSQNNHRRIKLCNGNCQRNCPFSLTSVKIIRPQWQTQVQQIVKCINDGNVQKVSSATISKKNDSRWNRLIQNAHAIFQYISFKCLPINCSFLQIYYCVLHSAKIILLLVSYSNEALHQQKYMHRSLTVNNKDRKSTLCIQNNLAVSTLDAIAYNSDQSPQADCMQPFEPSH